MNEQSDIHVSPDRYSNSNTVFLKNNSVTISVITDSPLCMCPFLDLHF